MRKGVFFIMGLIVLLLWSCNSEPSLQKYYVDHQDEENFMSMDISSQMVFQQMADLPKETEESLNRIKKINVLALPINGDNVEQYKKESRTVKKILDREDYHLLMKFNLSAGNLELRYKGAPEAIDEFVVLTYSDDKGFAIARILGKKMNPKAISDIIKAAKNDNIKINEGVLEDIFQNLE